VEARTGWGMGQGEYYYYYYYYYYYDQKPVLHNTSTDHYHTT